MKTAVITGAGSGIGAATAALFSSQGFALILVGRNKTNLQKVAGGLKNTTFEICDLKDSHAIATLGDKLVQNKNIEVLVNNAGIIERKDFIQTQESSLRDQFETNLFGPMLFTQKLLPMFYKKRSGAIVNVSSSLGIRPIAKTSAYSSSKAAMINWTQTLALEAGPYNVRVNAVCPGIVETPILTNHEREISDEERKMYGKLHPLGRVGTPAEVAQAIGYLSTAPWTTGSVLVVDGGISLT